MLRITYCLDNRLTDSGKTVSPTHPPHFTPQKHYYFFMFLIFLSVRGWVNPRAQCGRKGWVNLKKSPHRVSNPDLPVCSIWYRVPYLKYIHKRIGRTRALYSASVSLTDHSTSSASACSVSLDLTVPRCGSAQTSRDNEQKNSRRNDSHFEMEWSRLLDGSSVAAI
jgi:hypothetical protein